ncbi:hypothetical protein D3C84_827300 [compost metagenome]
MRNEVFNIVCVHHVFDTDTLARANVGVIDVIVRVLDFPLVGCGIENFNVGMSLEVSLGVCVRPDGAFLQA